MSKFKPTGRTRFDSRRTRWTKQEYLVLQIEVVFLATFYCAGYVDSEYRTIWRDATTKDCLVLAPNITLTTE